MRISTLVKASGSTPPIKARFRTLQLQPRRVLWRRKLHLGSFEMTILLSFRNGCGQ